MTEHRLLGYAAGAKEGVGPRLCSCGDELMNGGSYTRPRWMHDSRAHFGLVLVESIADGTLSSVMTPQ